MNLPGFQHFYRVSIARAPSRPLWCGWFPPDNEKGAWDTSCGNVFILLDGTPSDNRMKFCPYCGAAITEEKP